MRRTTGWATAAASMTARWRHCPTSRLSSASAIRCSGSQRSTRSRTTSRWMSSSPRPTNLLRGLRQARAAQQAVLLEDRIRHRREQRVDLFEVADRVEMERARLEALLGAGTQALEVALARLAFEIAHAVLLANQRLCRRRVAANHDVEGKARVVQHACVQVGQLAPAFRRESEPAL